MKDVLTLSERTGAFMPLYYALSIIAALFAESGEVERGVATYGLARERFAFVANSQWFEDVIGRPLAEVAERAMSPERIKPRRPKGEPWMYTRLSLRCWTYELSPHYSMGSNIE